MSNNRVSRFHYFPIIALALSFVFGGYLYNRTLDEWLTDIVSNYMLDLLMDVNHQVVDDKLHFYDFTPDEIDDFLDNLSQSSTQRRFTIIHESGKVLGDSNLTKHEITHLDDHSTRPEVIAALNSGKGIAKRLSMNTNLEYLYAAIRLEIFDHEHDALYFEDHADHHHSHDELNEQEHAIEHDQKEIEHEHGEEVDHHSHDDESNHSHDHEEVAPESHTDDHDTNVEEHEPHSNVYILRLAMPMTSLHNMSHDLRVILYLLMACSMGVLATSSWFSQRKITQAIVQEKQLQQVRIDQSTREIELLRQLANLLAACKNLNEAQLVVEDIVPRIMGNVAGCISIMRESQNLLEVEIKWGQAWPGATTFSPHDCWAMRRGKFHISHEDSQSLSCNHMIDSGANNTTMCIPLTAHGNTVGLFHLYFTGTDKLVSPETRNLAFTLAEHLGLALANLRLQEKLRAQAMRDPLTSLYNRRYFEQKLEEDWASAHQNADPLSLLILDLDHFKRFNDNFGHDAGDYVLKEIATLLNRSTNNHCPVCRLGGEEFAIICSNFSAEKAITLAEHIIECVRELHLDLKGLSLGQLGISVGISTYPDSDVTSDKLLTLADNALYKAKDQGRSQAVHANKM
ncbi:sensor domain-containing diguanylate cyclase [Vibrio hannami]|uniref:sensor domain-containing diguanylate cyclase n=1 Tax=Vibrio hannami TaxID=2717094 RepID=UPI0024101EE6|nr:sensor domain-containing diguanylate cyclase [Vibrio hannami]MDG3085230.1 sensor domain-containing diguanylate cyclase [Vibrio hannami]